MKTKIFHLSWSWYEECDSYLFFHENKTEVEFHKDVKFLLRKYGEAYLEQEDNWTGAEAWISFIAPKMEELGYEKVKTVNYDFFGSYIIGNEGEEDISQKDDMAFKKLVGKKLFDKAIKKNKVLTNTQNEKHKATV